MPAREPRILVVDSDPDLHEMAAAAFRGLGEVVWAPTRVAARTALDPAPDVMLLEPSLEDGDAFGLIELALSKVPLLTVLVLTSEPDLERAVAAITAGADDYLGKPIHPVHLRRKVERALVRQEAASELRELRDRTAAEQSPALRMLRMGQSPVMERLAHKVELAAVSDVPILVRGETGTGKELVSRAIHECSGRRTGPYITVNCGAIPAELIESELFGHKAGAFTGASGRRRGLVREAHGGTLFLDEIGELPLELQPKLLRFLQEGEIRPVGSDRPEPVDVRVVAATHRDLTAEVEAGRFREDLAYRIRVVELELPPLRDRGADIVVLADFFLREANARLGRSLKGFERRASRWLLGQSWDGNVRELQSVIHRAAVFAPGDELRASDLGEEGGEALVGDLSFDDELLARPFVEARDALMERFERAYVQRALKEADGNVAEAARRSGLARKSMWRIAKRVGMAADKDRRAAGDLVSDDAPLRTHHSGGTADPSEFLGQAARNYRIRTLVVVADLRGRLRREPSDADWEQAERAATRLQGSGGSFGLPELSRLAAELVRGCREQDAAAAIERLDAMEAVLTDADG